MFNLFQVQVENSAMLYEALACASDLTREVRYKAESSLFKIVASACYASTISVVEEVLGISSPDWIHISDEDKTTYLHMVRDVFKIVVSEIKYQEPAMDYLDLFAMGVLKSHYDIGAFEGELVHKSQRAVSDGIWTSFKIVSAAVSGTFAELVDSAYIAQDKLDLLFLTSYKGPVM